MGGITFNNLEAELDSLKQKAKAVTEIFGGIEKIRKSNSGVKVDANNKELVGYIKQGEKYLELLNKINESQTSVFTFKNDKAGLQNQAKTLSDEYRNLLDAIKKVDTDLKNGDINKGEANTKLATYNTALAVASQKFIDLGNAIRKYNEGVKQSERVTATYLKSIKFDTLLNKANDKIGADNSFFENTIREMQNYVTAYKEAVKNADASVKNFAVKDGQITVGVKLGATVKSLTPDLTKIVEGLSKVVEKNPILVPIKYTSDKNAKQTKDEIREQAREIEKPDESVIVKNLTSNLTSLTNAQVTAAKKIAEASIAEISKTIEEADVKLYPKLELKDENLKLFQQKLSEAVVNISPVFDFKAETRKDYEEKVKSSIIEAQKNAAGDLSGIDNIAQHVNKLNDISATGADFKKRMTGLPAGAKLLKEACDELPKDLNAFDDISTHVNYLNDISINGQKILESVKDLPAIVSHLNEANEKAITNYSNLATFINAANELSRLKVSGETFKGKLTGLEDGLNLLSNNSEKLVAINNAVGSDLSNIKVLIDALNDLEGITVDGKALTAKLTNLSGMTGSLKTISEDISTSMKLLTPGKKGSNFDLLKDAITKINDIKPDFSKLKELKNLPGIIEKFADATNKIPSDAELGKYTKFSDSVNKLNTITIDKRTLGKINNIKEVAKSIKTIVTSLPDDYKKFSGFVKGVNELSSITVDKELPNTLEKLKKTAGDIIVVSSMIPTSVNSFKPFVDAIKPLRWKDATLPDDIATKYEGLKALAVIIKSVIEILPPDYSKITSLFTALGSIGGKGINASDINNLDRYGDVLNKFKTLTASDFNTKVLLDFGEFLLLISDVKKTRGSIDNFSKLPGILEQIVLQLKELPNGTSKFYDFLTNVLNKKDELADLATIIKNGVAKAKKAEEALAPKKDTSGYEAIISNYNKLISYQELLSKDQSKENVGSINKQIQALEEEIEVYKQLITEKEYDGELQKQINLLAEKYSVSKSNYQNKLNAEREAASFKAVLENYKEIARLQSSMGTDKNGLNTVSVLKKQNEELLKGITLTEEQKKQLTKLEESYQKSTYDNLIKNINKYYSALNRINQGRGKTEQQDILAQAEAYKVLLEFEKEIDKYKSLGLITDEQITRLLEIRASKESDTLSPILKSVDSYQALLDHFISVNGQSEKFYENVTDASIILKSIVSIISKKSDNGFLSPDQWGAINNELSEMFSLLGNVQAELRAPDADHIFNEADLYEYLSALKDVAAGSVRVSKEGNILKATYHTIGGELVSVAYKANEATGAFKKFADSTNMKTGLSAVVEMSKQLKRSIASYISLYAIARRFISMLKQGLEVVKEMDKQLTEMRKVSNEPIETLKSYVNTSYEVAKILGTTATTIASSTADYMRLGKSLSDASKLAQDTALLMNVSEFENIKDATDAMISMTQAYQELSSTDIIDKLNNIGNNFSISTSDLAQSLQRSAGTLKVAGNDLNEAIALTVSGNAILQDPLKVAAGLRTISLRITGTEAAKKELEEIGEEVDDFVVTTSSKLNEKVLGLTKTATHEAGVSLLDELGNYRSTYEILQDIADVWQEIAAEDKLTGENRQNALLELLAGKNRSNVLASILSDAKLLRDVFIQVQDSSGSAMKEQQKYMESLEGHINQMKTAAEEFWNTFLSADDLKGYVDVGKQILEFLTSFTKTFGSGGTIASMIGIFAGSKGFSLAKILSWIGSGNSELKDLLKVVKQATPVFRQFGKDAAFTSMNVAGVSKSMQEAAIGLMSFKEGIVAIVSNISGLVVFLGILNGIKDIYKAIKNHDELVESSKKLSELQLQYDKQKSIIEELSNKQGELTDNEKERLAIAKGNTEELERQIKEQKELNAQLKLGSTLFSVYDKDTLANRYSQRHSYSNEVAGEHALNVERANVSYRSLISPSDMTQEEIDFYSGSYYTPIAYSSEEAKSTLKEVYDWAKEQQNDYLKDVEDTVSVLVDGGATLTQAQIVQGQEYLKAFKQDLIDVLRIQINYQKKFEDFNYTEFLQKNASAIKAIIYDYKNDEYSLDLFKEHFGDLYGIAASYYTEVGEAWDFISRIIGISDYLYVETAEDIKSLADVFKSLNDAIASTSKEAEELSGSFNDAVSSVNSLREAKEKLKNGELTSSEVLELIGKNPRLAPSVDWNDVNFGNLSDAITGEIDRIREEEIRALEDRQSQLEELLNPSEVSDELRKFYEEYQKALDDLEAHNASKDEMLFGNVDSSIRTTQSNVQEVGNVKVAVVPSLIVGNSEMPLNEVTVSNYLKEIISQATKDGEVDLGELLKLDAQGIYDNDYQGVIKNLIVAVGDAAEDTASKFNASASYYKKYNALLNACGGDTEALTQLSVLLGTSVEELTIEYEKNSTWLEYLKGVMSGGVKTLGELRTEYDDTTGKIKTLDDAVSKLLSKEMTDADVIDLMREFKELAQFDDIDLNDKVNFGNLLQHLMELRNTLPTPLIEALKELRNELAETASPETLAEIDTLIAGLQRAVTFDETGADAWTQAITDSLGRTNDTVQSTLSYFEDLSKLQEAIADGFVMDAEKAWELAAMFPELSKGIMEYGEAGDGLVELNEDIVNGLLEGGDTAIDASIKQLEAEKATLQGKRDATVAKLEMIKTALESEDELEKQKAIAELKREEDVANQKIEAEQALVDANQEANRTMDDNNTNVARSWLENFAEAAFGVQRSYSDSAASADSSSRNQVLSINSVIRAAHNLADAIKHAVKGEVAGSEQSGGGGGRSNIFGKITGFFKNAITSTNLKKAALNLELQNMQSNLQLELGNIDAAISSIDGQITTLKNLQGNAKDRIKKTGSGSGGSGGGGGGGGGGEGSDAAEEQFSETFDWIERAIEMVQKAVERLSKAAGDVYIKFSKRNKALLAEMDKVREEIALQQEAYITYMSIAESVELSEEYKSKVREGLLQIEEVEDEELAKKINLYKEWFDKATQCKDAIQDLEINLGDLAKQKFDNVSKEFEDAMSFIEHRANMVNKAMDKASERGFITSVQYYQALTRYENENLTNLKDKREALIEVLADGVKSGAVEEGSEAWYEMQNSINSVTEAIEDSEKALISYDNSIRDVYWDIFDRTRTTVAEITEEVEFLMGLLDNNPMFNGGDITKEGQAAYGLHAVSYQVYMEEAEAYAKEIQEINRQLATDPYDTVLIDRRKELIKLQRDMINNAEDEKEAMKKLTEDGIKSFLDAMKESIDAYKELMSDWKDNYTFQKNIDEQTAAIARLQKQLNAYSGDDSESGRLNSQKTMNSLRDAEEKLQESQRDHYISETEKILDNLYDEAESALNERLDHFEELLTTIFDGINANADTIGDTLRETVAEVNTSLSETMDEIWNKNSATSTTVTDAIAKYGEKVGTLPNNVTDSISTIEKYVKALLKAADATAAAELQRQEEEAKKTTVTTAVANQKSKVAANTSNHNVNTAVATGTKAKMTNTAVSSSGGSSSASASGSGANSTSSSGGKGGDFFVYKKYTDKSNLNLAQSIVDRLRYNDIDNSFENRAKYYEGMGFGAASTYYGTYEQNVKMLSWMKSHGYRRGLIKSNRNHWAMTQEDGLEVINSPKLGMLTPIGKGDTVFTADQTKALWTLSKDFANRVSKPDYNNGNTSTSNVFNLNIGIERVQDYNDFLRQLQGDNRFEKLVKACSIDQLNGANRVSKRRINI